MEVFFLAREATADPGLDVAAVGPPCLQEGLVRGLEEWDLVFRGGGPGGYLADSAFVEGGGEEGGGVC